jgi:3-hydroxyisobutyrate dehydrogenase
MLPNGEISRLVAIDIMSIMKKGSVLIDCSTIDVASAKKINELANESSINFLDAPVSGGVVGANSGSLTFMVGGKKDIYDRLIPLFDIMGQKSVFCGTAGSGQSAKICNNMILGVTMIATCEAFAAERKGLHLQFPPAASVHTLQSVSERCHLPRKAYRHQHHACVWVCRERPGAARHRKGE